MGDRGESALRRAGRWIFGGIFILAGLAHFARPDAYVKIMPEYLPYPRQLVLISGFFESVLGAMLLVPATRRTAAWGLIALLIAVFPANVDMFLHPEKNGIAPALLALRLPMQALLILWAWSYTGRAPADRSGAKMIP